MSARATLSKPAEAFLAELPEPVYEPLERETIGRRRALLRLAYTPGAERAIARHQVRTAEIEIAGVPCLEVLPESPQAGRTILYCYGGGFVVGSPFEDLTISAALAQGTGARVVSVNYRLAPEHPFPAARDDGLAVYRALAADGAPGALALAGESAGGNLALILLQQIYKEGLALPCALALLSPWADISNLGDSFAANRDPTLNLRNLEDAAHAYADGRDRRDPALSPLYGDFGPWVPPTLISSGTRDLLLSGCVRLARVMREAGSPVELRVWEGLWHVFEFFDQVPEGALSLGEFARFLDAVFDGQRP